MALGFLEKSMLQVNYIINQLQRSFDNAAGIPEVSILMYDPKTAIYGIFKQGKPESEPIGAVWFDSVIPFFRNATLNAVIFDPQNSAKHKLSLLFDRIKLCIVKRFFSYSFSCFVLWPNETSEAILGKLGFKKVGIKEKYVFADGQYRDVALYYRLATEV
jgi:hypothetical protein